MHALGVRSEGDQTTDDRRVPPRSRDPLLYPRSLALKSVPLLVHKLPMNTEVTRKGVVVVIDDDGSVRTALKELFESVGLDVKSYASGRAFLEVGIPDDTSCLVLDVRLPGTSGFKFQEELARAQIHMPIIFVTGHGDIPMACARSKLELWNPPKISLTVRLWHQADLSHAWHRVRSPPKRTC